MTTDMVNVNNSINNSVNSIIVKEEKEKVEESESWKSTKIWMTENCPRVMKMKDPFTESQFARIRNDYSSAQIKDILLKMHNYQPLLQKSVSANLTFQNWAKKEYNGVVPKANRTEIKTPQEWLQ